MKTAQGWRPLTDTNGDGIIDAGPETAAGTSTIVVTATLPPGTQVSSATTFIVNVVATSTNATASNFATPGIQDVIQDEVIIASTKNAAVDLYANATDTIGTGKGTSGETAVRTPATPVASLRFRSGVGNTGTNSAPDSYYLSFMYDGTAAVGNIVTVTPFTATAWNGTACNRHHHSRLDVLVAPNTGANCSTYGAPVATASSVAAAGNVEYCLLLQVPASYSANTYHFTIQAQSNSTGAIDQMAVQASVNTYHNVSISPNNQATAYAGGTVTYKHVITNGGNVTETNTITLNAPTLQATPTGWTIATYANTDGSALWIVFRLGYYSHHHHSGARRFGDLLPDRAGACLGEPGKGEAVVHVALDGVGGDEFDVGRYAAGSRERAAGRSSSGRALCRGSRAERRASRGRESGSRCRPGRCPSGG